MNRKYKVGDKVYLRDKDDISKDELNDYNADHDCMKQFFGKEVTILRSSVNCEVPFYRIKEDSGYCYYCEPLFAGLANEVSFDEVEYDKLMDF